MSNYLKPDKIIREDGLTINQKITPDGYAKKPNKSMAVKGITVHNTGMIVTKPDTNPAEQYARATYPNGNMGYVAVHYWVYKDIIWQQLKDTEQGWHAGSLRQVSKRKQMLSGNESTISIEIIGSDAQSEETGKKLVALLCKRHKLNPELDVYTHNFWMYGSDKFKPGARKNCPQFILGHWNTFVDGVVKLMNTEKSYLEFGDTGERVKILQNNLIALGYKPAGGADGSFGPGTKEMVMAFQFHHKLVVDGIAGPITLAKIEELLKAKAKAEAEEAARKAAEEEARKKSEEALEKAPEGKHYKVIVQFGAFSVKQYAEASAENVKKLLADKGIKVNGQDPIVKIIVE